MIKTEINTKTHFSIKKANIHNLKSISLDIPKNKLVVITGLSGSGKSSLAFDTLYAEGQRRYIESLSAYARQFLGKIEKPDVEDIKGLSPAIAIEQKVSSKNPRSTVGTSTEIYDFLKLLFARIGETFSPVSGEKVYQDDLESIVKWVLNQKQGDQLLLLSPIIPEQSRTLLQQVKSLGQQGFSRVLRGKEIEKIVDIDQTKIDACNAIYLIVDRFKIDTEEMDLSRVRDSVQASLYQGHHTCYVRVNDSKEFKEFNNKLEKDGLSFEAPSLHFFSFNNPIGACKKCEGYGHVIGIDRDLVIPNKNISVFEDAILCWRGDKMGLWKEKLIAEATRFNFPIHKPIHALSAEQNELLWSGNQYFQGLDQFFEMIEENSYKIQYRVMLSRYRGKTICPECKGTRLRKDAHYVKINDHSIVDLVQLSISDLFEFFQNLKLNKHQSEIAKRLLIEINGRLDTLLKVGLGYLNLNRLSSSLSGGESQRINLATSIGSGLVGAMYILDEPSIGLHPKNTLQLIEVLKQLKNKGNSVLVVEHEEEIMKQADWIIDLGPMAGTLGGELVYQGSFEGILKNTGLTAQYLSGSKNIPMPDVPRAWRKSIQLLGCRQNNLKGIDVTIPLGVLTVVTGVSGSGKSSLVKQVLYPTLIKIAESHEEIGGSFEDITGDTDQIKRVEIIDQNPIGRSSRSNPCTYIKAYDDIRELMSKTPTAIVNGFKPSHFSFNVEGGRCEKCAGEGIIKIEMQFMADIQLKCDQCEGKRFKKDTLEVEFDGKNIQQILELTVDDAIEFFETGAKKNNQKAFQSLLDRIVQKIIPLQKVGLGYVNLGQSSSTLSGGEAQRVKLASYLGKGGGNDNGILFIFDEPTTGLHIHDISKLLQSFDHLIQKGHSIVVVEHNMDVIKSADWVIDLGPEGGVNGGQLLFQGIPKELSKCKASHTGVYLKEKFESKMVNKN